MRRAVVLVILLAMSALALTVAPATSAGAQVTINTDVVAVREMLQHVPAAFRTTCTIADEESVLTDVANLIEASLVCSPSGADSVYYTRFSNQDALDTAFEEYLPATYEVRDATVGCEDSGTYSQSGKTAGRWFCGQLSSGDSHVAAYVWTQNATRVLTLAIRSDDDYQSLENFYQHEAGPFLKASSLGFPMDESATQRHKLARDLIAQVPKQSRQFCTESDLTDLSGLGGFAPYRAWIRAQVLCRPGGGATFVTYDLIGNANALSQIFRDIGSSGIEAHANATCPTSAPYARNQHEVGEYACYYLGEKGEKVGLLWTYRPKLILAFANRDDDRAKDLITFWRTRGGPIGSS